MSNPQAECSLGHLIMWSTAKPSQQQLQPSGGSSLPSNPAEPWTCTITQQQPTYRGAINTVSTETMPKESKLHLFCQQHTVNLKPACITHFIYLCCFVSKTW